jgi:hypothetical protein
MTILLLLLEALLKRRQSRQNPCNHKGQGNERPEYTPALRRPTVTFRENARIRRVDFPQYEIVANIPDAV